MNTVEILINNPSIYKLEVGDFDFVLNYNVNDIRTLGNRDSSFSKTITLPATPNNNFVLGNLFDVSSDFTMFNPHKKVEVNVLIDSVLVMSGIFKLEGVERLQNADELGGEMVYTGVIYSRITDLKTSLGEKKCYELQGLDKYNHTFNYDTIVGSWNNTEGYLYPLMPDLINGNWNYVVEDFRPAIFYHTLLKEVVNEAGFGIGGSLMQDERFLKEVIPYTDNGVSKVTINTASNKLVVAALIGSPVFNFEPATPSGLGINEVMGSYLWYSPNPTDLNFNFEVIDPSSQFTNGVLKVGNNGNYVIDIKFDFDINFVSGGNSFSSNYKWGFTFYVVKGTGANTTNLELFVVDDIAAPTNLSTTPVSNTFSFTFKTQEITLKKDDIIRFGSTFGKTSGQQYLLPNSTTPATVFSNVTIKPQTQFNFNLVSTTLTEGQPVNMRLFAPNLLQTDLLQDLIARYNVLIYPNPDNQRVIMFDSYNNFYKDSKIVDWTDKKDRSEFDNIQFLTDIRAKNMRFTYTEDSTKDDLNVAYKEGTGEVYGEYSVVFDNDFVTGEEVITTPFSPTISIRTPFGAYLPALERTNPVGNPRVLYYGGMKGVLYTYQIEGNDHTLYPYIGHLDDPLTPSIDLSFDFPLYLGYKGLNKPTDNNQYNRYWFNYISQIQEGKLLTAYFYLTPQDIADINRSLNMKVWVDDSYYFINKVVDYNAVTPSLTKVELLRVEELGEYSDTNSYDYINTNLDGCPTVELLEAIDGDTKIEYFVTTDGSFLNQACCEGYGGMYDPLLQTCIFRTYLLGGSGGGAGGIAVGGKIVDGTIDGVYGISNNVGGMTIKSTSNTYTTTPTFVGDVNRQLVSGNYNFVRGDNAVVIGHNNEVEGANVALINSVGSSIKGSNVTVLGVKDMVLTESNKIYLGEKLSVDTQTGKISNSGNVVTEGFRLNRWITSEEILELDVDAIRLIDGLSSSEYIIVDAVSIFFKYNSIQYVGDNLLEVFIWGCDPIFTVESALNGTVSGVYVFNKEVGGIQSTLGQGAYIRLKDPITAGNSSFLLTIDYRVVDTNNL